jgi:hypothetical protein
MAVAFACIHDEKGSNIMTATAAPPKSLMSFWGWYARYAASKAWTRKRRQTDARDGGRCRGCDAPGDLQCAHRTYQRVGHERPGDLMMLCDACHAWYDDPSTVWTKARKDAYLWAHPYLSLPQRGVDNDRALLAMGEARIRAAIGRDVLRETP